MNIFHPCNAFAAAGNAKIEYHIPEAVGEAMAGSVAVSALVVALIGAGSGLSAAFVAARAQQRVARLTASLGERRAESDARRSYEYEARKRLYDVYEPLRVRLLDCTDNAVRQIVDLVGSPGPGRPGYSSAEYRLNTTIYYLLAPLVVSRMIERRLTLVDLSLDARIHTEFMLAQAICRSLADEFRAAQLDPALPYSPYVRGWREKRQECPQRFRRQGLPLGRLNTALDELQVVRPEGVETLTTFGELEPLLVGLDPDDVRSGPGAARDLFFEFDPVTRPVLWRVLVIQVLLYWCFQRVVFGEGLPDPVDLEQSFIASDMHAKLLAALQSRSDITTAENLAPTTSAAVAYVTDRLAPGLLRIQLLAAAPRTLRAAGNA